MAHSIAVSAKAALLVAALTLIAPPATAATLVGEVKVDGGKRLKNLVVYLEPADAKTAAAVKHQRVTQKGRRFNPRISVIVAGGNVTYVNDEDQEIDHNVYSLSKTRKFDIGLASKGSKHTVEFTKPGVVKYYCSVHKNMDGIVVVVPSPYFAVLDKPGEFKLDGVPAGAWRLSAAITHRRYKAKPVALSITGEQPASVELRISRKRRKR
ncbi:MAG: plastocyanin/azurin family copper-binding protein [Rhodospirillales bacterium]|jgi:plastocyanin|nr:plastocyanin/azurin family copper-binding protein [Rhodospirillales bacterium]MDP6646110.1 plastocyanin/azurin family copper-binding protein [Rhodospirillales bacterium]MDP6842469.1 plastocyanin/azurin family copper-binding protein [Rhodospirillales bacterium]